MKNIIILISILIFAGCDVAGTTNKTIEVKADIANIVEIKKDINYIYINNIKTINGNFDKSVDKLEYKRQLSKKIWHIYLEDRKAFFTVERINKGSWLITGIKY